MLPVWGVLLDSSTSSETLLSRYGRMPVRDFGLLWGTGTDNPVSAQCMQIQKPGIPPMCDGGYCAVGPNWRFFEGVSVPVAQKEAKWRTGTTKSGPVHT